MTTIGIFDVATSTSPVEPITIPGSVNSVAFSFDGASLFVPVDEESRVARYETSTGDLVSESTGQPPPDDGRVHIAMGVAVLPGGDVVVGSESGRVRVLDGETLGELHTVEVPPLTSLELDPEHWVEAACRMVGRNLTREEWVTNIGDLAEHRTTCPEFPLELEAP